MRSLIFAASLLIATPSLATEWIYCGNAEQTVSLGVLVGSFDFINISATTLHIKGEDWASSETYGPGKPVNPAQAYFSDNQIVIDLTDEDHNEVLAELRVYVADEGEDYVQAGVLRSPGRGAWAVTCEGP